MASFNTEHHPEEHEMKKIILKDEKGAALIMALLISAVIMIMAAAVLYFVRQSTTMSGVGKRYATAAQAADGAIEVLKDTINLVQHTEDPANVFEAGNCIVTAIRNEGPQGACNSTTIILAGIDGNYRADVTITNLFPATFPGGRLEFARSGGGAASSGIFYRITTRVTGPNNEVAENAALYRYTE